MDGWTRLREIAKKFVFQEMGEELCKLADRWEHEFKTYCEGCDGMSAPAPKCETCGAPMHSCICPEWWK